MRLIDAYPCESSEQGSLSLAVEVRRSLGEDGNKGSKGTFVRVAWRYSH